MKFRMVDQILSWDAGREIRGVKAVSFEEYCARSSLTVGQSLPESLVLESLIQLGNWLVVLSSEFSEMSMVVEIDRVEFGSALGPGERMTLQASIQQRDAKSICFTGRARVDDRAVIIADGWRTTLAPLQEYVAPDDLRVLFSEIYRPTPGGAA